MVLTILISLGLFQIQQVRAQYQCNPVPPISVQAEDLNSLLIAVSAASSEILAEDTCFANVSGGLATIEQAIATQQLSEDELVARLTFAEAVASNCIRPNFYQEYTGHVIDLSEVERQALTDGIMSVIRQRIEGPGFGSNAHDVVFARSQFNSTFGGYSCDAHLAFLCPSSFPEYEGLRQNVLASLDRTRTQQDRQNIFGGETVPIFYFLYMHFGQASCSERLRQDYFIDSTATDNWPPEGKRVPVSLETSSRLDECVQFNTGIVH